ncbi:MAG: U32 family peptidase [Prevotellaceae bacterium]|jgi:putative protease|nr:U32 family peptidase [Prevotellaceae bacterium]
MLSSSQLELMSPAGNFECLTAAIQGGANAVYFGVGKLNMRARSANNFQLSDLHKIANICKQEGLRSYLTVNTVLYDEELSEMQQIIDVAQKAGISAIIASDMAAIQYARTCGIEVHLSTQVNITNIEALRFYANFADVVVLSRELTLEQTAVIHEAIQEQQIKGPNGKHVQIEMFCHGALCMAVSGKCYLSLHEYNASANRGSCYQLCRRGYTVTDNDSGRQLVINNEYIMSPKDLCTIAFLDKMVEAGIRVFKIEGRARSAEYVKTVTNAYHRALQAIVEGSYNSELATTLTAELQTVFNRGFWDGYYQGARLGKWSEVYGNKATRRKIYIAKAMNYFSNLGVAEFYVETSSLKKGDEALIIGPTTGVMPVVIDDMRVDLQAVDKVEKGTYFSIAVPEKVRRADKLYKLESVK